MFVLIISLVLMLPSTVIGHRNGLFDQSPILPPTDSISPQQKALLHEVADLMLDIYQTLVDMRYLEPVGVIQGPHNMTALEPQFEELDIDPSIRYLYSILPYVDANAAGNSDFLLESVFADFRDPDEVEQARNPFYVSPLYSNLDDEDVPNMRSWYTPLTQLGGDGSVIVYDARRHLIWIIDQQDWATNDLALQDVEPKEVKTANRNGFERIPSRPAGEVLRDIVQWYRNLDILPGGGENTYMEWDHNDMPLRDLYTANGWPDHFDADAFQISQARRFGRSMALDFANRPLKEVERLKIAINRFSEWIQLDISLLSLTQSKEREWEFRSRIWKMKLDRENMEEDLIIAEKKASELCPLWSCVPAGQWPLYELQALSERIQGLKGSVANGEARVQSHPYPGQDDEDWQAEIQLYTKFLHLDKQKLAVYEKAYDASREDAERLCPGQTFQSVTGLEDMGYRKGDLLYNLFHAQRELEATREWLAQLPDDVPVARSETERLVERLEFHVDRLNTEGF